jgi:hypothetical protein
MACEACPASARRVADSQTLTPSPHPNLAAVLALPGNELNMIHTLATKRDVKTKIYTPRERDLHLIQVQWHGRLMAEYPEISKQLNNSAVRGL